MSDIYLVEWTMEYEAESPEDAALQAYGTLQDPGNTATIFAVRKEGALRWNMIDTEGGEAEPIH